SAEGRSYRRLAGRFGGGDASAASHARHDQRYRKFKVRPSVWSVGRRLTPAMQQAVHYAIRSLCCSQSTGPQITASKPICHLIVTQLTRARRSPFLQMAALKTQSLGTPQFRREPKLRSPRTGESSSSKGANNGYKI